MSQPTSSPVPTPEHPTPQPAHATCAVLLAEAEQAQQRGDHRSGVRCAEAALAACAPEDHPQRAAALRQLALHRWRLGLFEDAILAAREALSLLDAAEDSAPRCEVLCLMAISYSEIGLQEEALKQATAAFELARQQGDRLWMSWSLNRIGTCYERLGDPAQGERFLLQALGEAQALQDADTTLTALNNLMATMVGSHYLCRRRGDEEAAAAALRKARLYGSEALALARQTGDSYRQAVTGGNLGEVLGLSGDRHAAFELLDGTLAIARAQGYRAVELRTLHSCGEVLTRCGDHEPAVELLEAALRELENSEHEATRMRVHSALHRSYKALGRYREALDHCETYHALELKRAAAQHQAQARLMVNRIEVEQALLQGERARLDAERQRLKATELEAEKHRLEVSARELHRHALEDQLTGLANRRRVDRDLPQLFGRARELGRPLSMAVADLDNFKSINDTHGHLVGDEVLRAAAKIFRANTRGSDVLARFGGEEFLLLFVDTPLPVAQEVCERLRSEFESYPWHELAPSLSVTISLGLCDATPDPDAAQMLARADGALYRAKRAGRNRVKVDASRLRDAAPEDPGGSGA
jgi:diguanylate cyclase (GGDEF)-like protein